MLQALKWAHTVRHLRPVQLYGRAWFILHSPSVDLSPAPPLRPRSQKLPLLVKRTPSLLGPRRFRFLNEEHELADADSWDSPSLSKLWRYNLHYFDDLTAEGAETRTLWHRDLMLRWIHENTPGSGTGWEPYPTSLRIVNWIRWALAGNMLPPECLQSLAVQTRWLTGRLERHLLGNHLWANAKALAFAGMFFEGPEADRWLTVGLKLLRRELKEQVLADGGHFERSPMYHAIVLSDLLDLAQLNVSCPGVLPEEDVAAWRESVPSMLHWLSVMTHPDGTIALFNDAAFGIAPRLTDLEAGAKALGIGCDARLDGPVHDLPESGYVRLRKGPAVLIVDAGNIGPDYLPGHGHADTLSFELSLFGRPVIVDTGTSRYDLSEERLMQRGTRAHNTVQVDGADSSEVWGSFRVARRAKPLDRNIKQDHGALIIDSAHNGYLRLRGRSLHRRQWHLTEGSLVVRDRIEGSCSQAVARFHFHPDIEVKAGDGAGKGSLLLPEGKSIVWRMKGGRQDVVPGTYHPEFGLSIPNQCLEIVMDGNELEVEFSWS